MLTPNEVWCFWPGGSELGFPGASAFAFPAAAATDFAGALDLGFFRSRSIVMGDLQTHGDGGELQLGTSGCVCPPLHTLLMEEPMRLRKPLEVQLTARAR